MLDERAERGDLLVGRSRETARIEGLLTAAEAGHGGALVVRGEAGVGKSALLEYAAGRASGFTVLRGGGVEGESGLAYAALHLILHPVLDGIERLPAPQSAALRGAFALSDAAVDERFGVALGCLGLMSEEAEKRPVLCLIDDAQWLDQASADALLFAARRLERERMLMVFAVRDPDDRGFVARGIPEAHLEALGSTAARELLAARLGAGVASGVIEWLVENANGNPLALLELPSTLTPQQLSGQHPLAGVVAPPTSVEELYLERVQQLAPATQRVLLVAACEGAGARASVEWALDALGLDVADLTPAEAAGLVRVDSEHITFRHPLVRTAVYRSAAFTDREQAHRVLASAAEAEGSPDRAAWHRAVATVGTDESVAAQLESTAERARVRSGHAAAAAALEAAAGLSEDETARARRLAAAAAAAWAAGLPDRATVLLDRATPSVTDPVLSAEMDCLRGLVEWRCGVLTDACGTLVGGAARMAALDPTLTLDVLADAALASWDTGDYQNLAAAGAAVRALPEPADRQHQLLGRVLTGAVALSEGPGGGDLTEPDQEPDVAEVLSACRAAADFDDARLLIWAAIAAELAGESSLETALLDRAASHARASGAVDRLIVTLESTTVQGFLAGNFTISAEANEGLRLAVETGLDNAASLFRACLGWLAAVRGDRGACRQYVAAALEVSLPHRHGIANAIADWALALLDLGTGRPDDAAERLQRMSGFIIFLLLCAVVVSPS
jgi:hypothetical protein